MTLVAEVPTNDRRKAPRSSVMIPALLDQFPVTVTDISLAGVGAGQFEMMIDGELGPARGQHASLRFIDQDDPEDSIEIEIVRVSRQRGSIGARYVSLTPEQESYLKTLVEQAA